jgi:hypothetical protein
MRPPLGKTMEVVHGIVGPPDTSASLHRQCGESWPEGSAAAQ